MSILWDHHKRVEDRVVSSQGWYREMHVLAFADRVRVHV